MKVFNKSGLIKLLWSVEVKPNADTDSKGEDLNKGLLADGWEEQSWGSMHDRGSETRGWVREGRQEGKQAANWESSDPGNSGKFR